MLIVDARLRGLLTRLHHQASRCHLRVHGKQKTVIDANGNRAEMTYDGFDRQARWVFPSPSAVSGFDGSSPERALATAGAANPSDWEGYEHDPNGNRTVLRKRDGTRLTYTYDALDRVVQKNVPATSSASGAAAGYSVYTGYDNRGLELYAQFGSAFGQGVTNAYDNAGRLTSSTSNMDGTARTWSHQLDGDGNVLVLSGDAGYQAAFSYDGLDRMTEYQSVFQIGYDAAGRRAGIDMGPGATSWTSWRYDPAGRLQTQAHGLADPVANQSVTFGYNPASQVVSEARTNDAYASTSAIDTARTYRVNGLNQYSDVAGNSYAYDLNGNLISDGINSYAYDAENRLVSRSGGVSLSYDPLGRLWQVSGPSSLSRFLYDGDRLVQEYDGAGNATSGYVHGPGADEPLTWYSAAGRRHLHADHQGSITAIADDPGNTVKINGYEAWGVPNAGNIGRFGYTGQVWLPELGMWYYKARIYSPMLGRFLQTDPIGYKDQNNLYAYVGNDPVDGRDPTGLFDDRTVRHDPATKTTTITIPVKITGSGSNATSLARVQAVASQVHAPAGENPIIINIVAALNSDGDTQTVDLSPGKDFVHYNNGQGEGNNIAARTIHIDSTRTDAPAATFHDLAHGGRGGQMGAQDRYHATGTDSSGHTTTSAPDAGYGRNIMGTTSGREITNAQVSTEIAPVSTPQP